jgi:hypothetical protein
MNDIEMTKLCAEAMGFKVHETSHNLPEHSLRFNIGGGDYWPLNDDAQAMALVKSFKLSIGSSTSREVSWAWYVCVPHEVNPPKSGYDTALHVENTDLNRAIVECVAKMQSTKP